MIEIVEAEADENDRRRGENDPDHVDLDLRAALVAFKAETQQKDHRRERDENAEGGAPADIGPEDAADEKRRDAGAGVRRTERTQRRCLLGLVIVLGD
jgi:hypothetical protein